MKRTSLYKSGILVLMATFILLTAFVWYQLTDIQKNYLEQGYSWNGFIYPAILFLTFTGLFLFFLIWKSIQVVHTQSDESKNQIADTIQNNATKKTEKDDDKENLKNMRIIERLTTSILSESESNILAEKALVQIAKEFDLVQAMFYLKRDNADLYDIAATYAWFSEEVPVPVEPGNGLAGQAVRDKKLLYLTELPEKYLTVISGLGKGSPKYLAIVPVSIDNVVYGVVELASFVDFQAVLETIIQPVLTNTCEKLVQITGIK